VANGVKTEKRPISDTICCTDVVAVFGPSDHFAAAAACRAKSARHELADGRRSRQLTGTKLFEGLRNPGGWHDAPAYATLRSLTIYRSVCILWESSV